MPDEAASFITRPPVEIFGQYPGYGFAGLGGSTAIGALGPDWTTSFSASLVVTPAQGEAHDPAAPVTFNDEDSRILIFAPDGPGGFTSPQDLLASLTQNADGSFVPTFNSRVSAGAERLLLVWA